VRAAGQPGELASGAGFEHQQQRDHEQPGERHLEGHGGGAGQEVGERGLVGHGRGPVAGAASPAAEPGREQRQQRGC
jgi:hypothetical protein